MPTTYLAYRDQNWIKYTLHILFTEVTLSTYTQLLFCSVNITETIHGGLKRTKSKLRQKNMHIYDQGKPCLLQI